jgi:hypothetical protein
MVVAWDRSPVPQNPPNTVHAQRYDLFPDGQAAVIGGRAWDDADGDGVRDPGGAVPRGGGPAHPRHFAGLRAHGSGR